MYSGGNLSHRVGLQQHADSLCAQHAACGIRQTVCASRIKHSQNRCLKKSVLDTKNNGRANANRQAVQELLWLLETVSTAFRGTDAGGESVQGEYFNKIVKDLRRNKKGERIEQVLGWMMTLHRYLSSPTGGGVRHGIDISASTEELDPNEARLFCNLIRSYILFLLGEHNRLSRVK